MYGGGNPGNRLTGSPWLRPTHRGPNARAKAKACGILGKRVSRGTTGITPFGIHIRVFGGLRPPLLGGQRPPQKMSEQSTQMSEQSPQSSVLEINDSKSYRSASTRRKNKKNHKTQLGPSLSNPVPGSFRELPPRGIGKTSSWSSRLARLAQQKSDRPQLYEQKLESRDASF